jgi:hypothetical protein
VGNTFSCNVHYDCPSGQTCWTTDGFAFDCMSSGALQAGATCALILGSATCGDGLACVAAGNPNQGECDSWCDVSTPCPSGTCTTITDTNGVSLSLCQ